MATKDKTLTPKKRRDERDVEASAGVAPTVRKDLRFVVGEETIEGERACTVEDPLNGESFAFGEKEYFLCQAMDGVSSREDILDRFEKTFGKAMSPEALRSFEGSLTEMGLMETGDGEVKDAVAIAPKRRHARAYHWSTGNPTRAFEWLMSGLMPIRIIFLLVPWILLVTVPVAAFFVQRHWSEILLALESTLSAMSFVAHLVFSLLLADAIRCVARGLVLTYYKVPPDDSGFRLRWGVIPRVYVTTGKYARLNPTQKLWYLGTNPFMRLAMFVVGTAGWSLFHLTSPSLAAFGIIFALAGVIGLIVTILPMHTSSDGLRLASLFFGFSPNAPWVALTVLKNVLLRKPQPPSISVAAKWKYCGLAVFLIVAWTSLFFWLGLTAAGGFEKLFPGAFGNATWYVLCLLVFCSMIRWATLTMFPKTQKNDKTERVNSDPAEDNRDDEETGAGDFFREHKKLFVGLILLGLAFVPFPYRPGGEIQVLPPDEREIQAPVSGKVAEVFFPGGDGQFISRNAEVARMVSSEIETRILTLEQIKIQQAAKIDKLKSDLDKLVAGARSEEIAAAEAKLQQAIEETSIAVQELASAKVNSEYSQMLLPRIEKLYNSGSVALLQFEETKRNAHLNKIGVERQQNNLSSLVNARNEAKANLDLLRSGSRKEDIQSARHEVNAATAELGRIDQQIQYTLQQQSESSLLMPIDGYLVESRIDSKKGTYLKVGDVFATAQNNSQPRIEVRLPEYDIERVGIGAAATVRLSAYPSSSLQGKVTAIEPVASTGVEKLSGSPTARMFQILIEIDKPPFAIKSGMSGYAKISAGFSPLGMLLLRPVIRFVQIEMWSWMP